MKNLLSLMSKSLVSATVFGLTLIIIVYAANITSLGNTINEGDTIEKGWFNDVEKSVVPAGAIIPFNQETCPDGWISADGASGTVDLRGEFIRGRDNERGVDEGRTLGSFQGDMLGSHKHRNTRERVHDCSSSSKGVNMNYRDNSCSKPRTTYTNSFGGIETRPRNVALLYCVKQ